MASHPVGSPGSVARRVHDALDAVDESLVPPKNAGDWYENQRRRAERIRELIKAEADPAAMRILRQALDRAEDVGD